MNCFRTDVGTLPPSGLASSIGCPTTIRTRDRLGNFDPGGKAGSVPPIPIGMTFAFVLAAKKAAPSYVSPTVLPVCLVLTNQTICY